MTHKTESDKAVALFSAVPKAYNCAQAVAKAFNQDDMVMSLKTCGNGRAEGGLCGALYVAVCLLPEEKRERVKEQFKEMCGNVLCKAIRKEGKTSCVECVRIATELAAVSF